MKTLTLTAIEQRVRELAAGIGARRNMLPNFGHSEQSGRPHVEVDAENYYYVVAERGQEFERYATTYLDDLLYRIFADITFELSAAYEVQHRAEDQDHRRILFERQIELVSMLSLQWAEREKQQHERILSEYPFRA